MRYRALGRSGLKVSSIGLGSWLTFGARLGKEEVRSLTRRALDAGINFIDTADVYERGLVEENLGHALEGVERSRYVLATKCFSPMTSEANDRGLSRKHIFESVKKSLRRLRTDYLDLLQCHRYDTETPLEETVLAMSDLIRRGDILYWGVSCWTAQQVTDAVRLAEKLGARAPISNQPPYSMLERDQELDFEPDFAQGVGQVVFSPLAQGALSGKYRAGSIPAGTRAADPKRTQWMAPYLTEEQLARIERVSEIARRLGLTPAQLALAWVLRRPEVASAIQGCTSAAQLDENVKAGDVVLEAATIDELEKALGNAPERRKF